MASKKKVNRDNLEAMGARRLAELLMDFAESDAAVKRRLRLELAAKGRQKAWPQRSESALARSPALGLSSTGVRVAQSQPIWKPSVERSSIKWRKSTLPRHWI